ncbi:MAG: hypothetical protein Q3M30_14810 [Candidatus Electrothrix sp. Rat3]|nr:hypothetical protein [Candidatus Electrothrix rattekaaiensis]
MKTTICNPIVTEVRKARDNHAAQFGYDIKRIFRDIKKRQQASKRRYARYPARPALPGDESTSAL